jgi:4-amino-4-deoxy-L-arabinose transferase-like glycosyltransferase
VDPGARLRAAAPPAVVTAVAALLRLWSFGGVAPNPFYDAAARSMSLSWHNLFFGAFDPGGQTAIDKPPLDLWLQVASIRLLGFGPVATRLPEALAGIAAVPLLYDLVRRLFGRAAALAAAAALAVLPAAVLTARSDTMDPMMMLLDVLAAWLVVLAAQRRAVWPAIAAGAVLGLAFNAKLFQGLIAVPAIGLLGLVGLRRQRTLALAGGLVACLAVSLSWIAAASLTPLGARPWPIGSTDGSIWNVVFVFNGLDRLTGHASAAALARDPPGALRLFAGGYAASVGSLLLAALVLGAAAAAGLALRRRRLPRPALAGAAWLGVWLVVGVALLSHMERMQPRYLEAVTPAVAAAAGAGLASLVWGARTRRGAVLLAAAVTGVAAGGALLARPAGWAVAAALAGAAACALAAAVRARPATLLAFGLAATLAVPASAAVAVARAHRSDAGAPVSLAPSQLAALSRFLLAHQRGARYEAASTSAFRAAPLIIRDARPVLSLTSVYGRPLLGAARLRALVAAGRVRYVLGREACGGAACAGVVRWASGHSHDVSRAAGLPAGTVYRLALG